MPTTYPLAPQDIDFLRRIDTAGSRQMFILMMGAALLAFPCIVLLGLIVFLDFAKGNDAALVSGITLACLAFAGAIFWAGWRQRRQLLLPLRAVLARNAKSIVRGTLSQVDVLPEGRLRYIVDSEAVDVTLLLGRGERESHAVGQPLLRFRHLNDTIVELHCVSLSPGATLLLQAHYPLARQAVRTERPAGASDQCLANKAAKPLAIIGAIVCGAVMLVAGLVSGFEPELMAITGAVCLVVGPGSLAIALLPQFLRARRYEQVATLEGPVTEIITCHLRTGKHSYADLHWYRVDGTLLCPWDVGDGSASVGNLVKVEFMTRKGRPGERILVNFNRIVPARH